MNPKRSRELVFVPLGGAGEIGMNLNLYGLGTPEGHDWLMVDLGISFTDGDVPGVEVIMPDPGFIVARRDRLAGLVLTHAHEDHLGAVPYLWPQLRCPVYATPFTAAFLKRKLAEAGLQRQVPLHVVPVGGQVAVGPFHVEMIGLTHSIPEPNAVAIRTDVGTVVHATDWKFDPEPVVGPTANEAALHRLGEEGVLALVCDSTNIFSISEPASEGGLLRPLTEIIGGCKGRVAVTCFASNVARLHTVAMAAEACNRSVALVGRSLHRIVEVARESGLLLDVPAFVDERDIAQFPDDKMLFLCTGCQGEPRAALSRIATDSHPHLTLGQDDLVIFSSRDIPGNEKAIGRVQNELVKRGVRVVTWRDHPVHVSGHPGRVEIERMYRHIRPKVVLPIHGETRHLHEQARVAETYGIPAVVAEDGAIVRLTPGVPTVVDDAPVGRLALDGERLVPLDGEVIRGRTRAIFGGSVAVTVVLDRKGRSLADPVLSTQGLLEPDEEDDILPGFADAVAEALDDLSAAERKDDEAVEEAVRRTVRRSVRQRIGKKPVVQVHLVRV